MTKPVATKIPSWVYTARTTLLTFAFLTVGTAQAASPCPQLSGTYAIAGEMWSVNGVLRVLDVGVGVGQTDYVGGALIITADEQGRLTVQARPLAIDPLRTYETRTLQSPLDYMCKGGWIVMQSQTKIGRNVGQSSYEGVLTLRFKPLVSDNDDSLQLELTFKGHKTVNLFSYDSAHIDIGILWSRYSNVAKMEWVQTASRVAVPQ